MTKPVSMTLNQQKVTDVKKRLIASWGTGVPGRNAVKTADKEKAEEPELSKLSPSTVANVQDQLTKPKHARQTPTALLIVLGTTGLVGVAAAKIAAVVESKPGIDQSGSMLVMEEGNVQVAERKARLAYVIWTVIG